MNTEKNKKFELENKWQAVIEGSAVAMSVNINKWNIHELPIELRNNKNVMLSVVKRDCYAFKYVSQELQNDPEVILAAIELGNPSFMGKADDENILARSLESISKHPHLVDSADLNFLYVSKHNFPMMEREVQSMNRYKKIFSDEAKHLRMMKRIYREKINILMKRIREDDKYQKEQDALDLLETQRKEEHERYIAMRVQIEQMPRYERWKEEVKEKCGKKCQIDESHKNRYTEVHHLTSFYKILKQNNITSIEKALGCRLLWDIDNGIVLCKECHDKMESSQNRQNLIKNKQ